VIGLGSDKVAQLFDPSWYGDHEAALGHLFRVARVAYAVRAGEDSRAPDADTAGRWSDRLLRLALPPEVAAVSSSEVRRRLRQGEAVSDLVPSEVLAYLPPG
jgi:nicotinic acid mononucleotide adenylyltransferase